MSLCCFYSNVRQLVTNPRFILCSSNHAKFFRVVRYASFINHSGQISNSGPKLTLNHEVQDVSTKSNNSLPDEHAQHEEDTKILRAAIIGPPNVGKSTLINQILERRVFAISRKVHTTRCRARGAFIEGKTQLVILDTPGLVSGHEAKKYKLEKSFFIDGEASMQEADILVVIHDVANGDYSAKLEPRLLRLLHLYRDKEAILVMNKIDCIKNKRFLLDLADVLTCNNNNRRKKSKNKEDEEFVPKTEFSVQKTVKNKKGWPHFKEVFMVSAISGSGVGDIKEYLLRAAKPGEWIFSKETFTDQNHMKIIEDTIRSQLLDSLPNEVPYNLTIQMEYFDQKIEGTITTVVLVGCKTRRLEKVVMGRGGVRIREVAKSAEQELQNVFRVPVRLRIVVTKSQDRKVDQDELLKNGYCEEIEMLN